MLERPSVGFLDIGRCRCGIEGIDPSGVNGLRHTGKSGTGSSQLGSVHLLVGGLWLDSGKRAHGKGRRRAQGDKQDQDITHGKLLFAVAGFWPTRTPTRSSTKESRSFLVHIPTLVPLMRYRSPSLPTPRVMFCDSNMLSRLLTASKIKSIPKYGFGVRMDSSYRFVAGNGSIRGKGLAVFPADIFRRVGNFSYSLQSVRIR